MRDYTTQPKRMVVLGAGESGVGAALLAKQLGYDLFVSDKGKIAAHYKKELEAHSIPYEEGKHTLEKLFNASEVVKSPGIPDHIKLIKELHAKGIPVISEIEFAARHTSATLIAITGSNGKTTTTNLTYHLLKTAGLNIDIGGNIGYSFARLVARNQRDFYVLELSSFQLDGIVDFCPHIAILLNITPDHLDRYAYKMEYYIRSKFRIISNQQASDHFIYNEDDKHMQAYMQGQSIIPQTYAIGTPVQSDTISIADYSFSTKGCSLKGIHNLFNATCAIRTALLLGASATDIQEGLYTFQNAAHRLEPVAKIKGIEYINDSKATNVDAVYYALHAMEKPIVWIAGGTDKGNDYEPLAALVAKKVKALVCLGIDNQKLLEVFSPIVKNIEECQSAATAVERAQIYAEKGDVILLSPACASFDLFNNYEDRGDQFKAAVKKLAQKN